MEYKLSMCTKRYIVCIRNVAVKHWLSHVRNACVRNVSNSLVTACHSLVDLFFFKNFSSAKNTIHLFTTYDF